MKSRRLLSGLIVAAALSLLPAGAQDSQEFMENRWVAILSVYPKFSDALSDAKKIASEAGETFSMEGRVYDSKRGLIYPDNFDEAAFAGQYVARRENEAYVKDEPTPYLSVERSDGYDGFKPGYYIVVAGIYDNAAAARARTAEFKKWAPTAYAKKTRIYMGCMH